MADAILPDNYLNAIKQFEGFTPRASWDYAQFTNGYGTKAAHPGEVIDKDTADQRFNTEIGKAASSVDAAFPTLPEGARAALTSLTFNAGPGWINSSLGKAVQNGDWATARNLFQQYSHAGGQVLPGLVNRRAQEGAWLVGAQGPQDMAASGSPPGMPTQAGGFMGAQAMGSQATPASGVSLFGGGPQNASQGAPGAAGANPMLTAGLGLMGGDQAIKPMPWMTFQPLQRPQVNVGALQGLLQRQA